MDIARNLRPCFAGMIGFAVLPRPVGSVRTGWSSGARKGKESGRIYG
jgi:hypothetical protein